MYILIIIKVHVLEYGCSSRTQMIYKKSPFLHFYFWSMTFCPLYRRCVDQTVRYIFESVDFRCISHCFGLYLYNQKQISIFQNCIFSHDIKYPNLPLIYYEKIKYVQFQKTCVELLYYYGISSRFDISMFGKQTVSVSIIIE